MTPTNLEKLRAGLERVGEFQHGPLSIPLYDVDATNTLMRQAADEIEELRVEVKRLHNRINEDADRHARELHDVAETAIAEDRWHRKETP